jgi:hypothetical protein
LWEWVSDFRTKESSSVAKQSTQHSLVGSANNLLTILAAPAASMPFEEPVQFLEHASGSWSMFRAHFVQADDIASMPRGSAVRKPNATAHPDKELHRRVNPRLSQRASLATAKA